MVNLYLFRSQVLLTMWEDLRLNQDNGLDVIEPWMQAIEQEYYNKTGQDIRTVWQRSKDKD